MHRFPSYTLRVRPSCLPRCRCSRRRCEASFLTFRGAGLVSFLFHLPDVVPLSGESGVGRSSSPAPARGRLSRAAATNAGWRARIMSKLVKAYVNGRFGDRHDARIISDRGEERRPGSRCRRTAHALSPLPRHPFLIFSPALPWPTSRANFAPPDVSLLPCGSNRVRGWFCVSRGPSPTRAVHDTRGLYFDPRARVDVFPSWRK